MKIFFARYKPRMTLVFEKDWAMPSMRVSRINLNPARDVYGIQEPVQAGLGFDRLRTLPE